MTGKLKMKVGCFKCHPCLRVCLSVFPFLPPSSPKHTEQVVGIMPSSSGREPGRQGDNYFLCGSSVYRLHMERPSGALWVPCHLAPEGPVMQFSELHIISLHYYYCKGKKWKWHPCYSWIFTDMKIMRRASAGIPSGIPSILPQCFFLQRSHLCLLSEWIFGRYLSLSLI